MDGSNGSNGNDRGSDRTGSDSTGYTNHKTLLGSTENRSCKKNSLDGSACQHTQLDVGLGEFELSLVLDGCELFQLGKCLLAVEGKCL